MTFSFHFLISFLLLVGTSNAQMITGVWHGKIDRKKVELIIVQNGDSLTGTSYYYESPQSYSRYTIKGYFDPYTNSAVWWDDQLIEEKTGKTFLGKPGKIPYLSTADFNCPGSGKMFLDGDAAVKENPGKGKKPVDLEKTEGRIFNDEWNFLIDNYTIGANDPYIIDSIANMAAAPDVVQKVPEREKEIVTYSPKPEPEITINKPSGKPAEKTEPVINQSIARPGEKKISIAPVPTIEEKFVSRKKEVTTEIPLAGDSIELRFYDNAEIDGDSISLFLNDKLVFEHIRLTASAYIIKLPVHELNETNELVMVAENLGSIPPNTSYMLAIVNDKRYEAMLRSTEETSAVIRLVKPKNQNNSQAKN